MKKYEMLKELLQDEEQVRKVFSEDIYETQKNLKALGMDFTESELEDFAREAVRLSEKCEMSAEDLDQVSGGCLGGVLIGCAVLNAVCEIAKMSLNRRH